MTQESQDNGSGTNRVTVSVPVGFEEDVFEELANDFYGGNKSQCFRSAVLRDNDRKRNGDVHLLLEQLVQKQQNSKEINELRGSVETLIS